EVVQRCGDAREETVHRDVEDGVQLGARRRRQIARGVGRGIPMQDRNVAERRSDLRQHRLDLFGIGNVARKSDGADADSFEGSRRLGETLRRARYERDVETLTAEPTCDGVGDTASVSRNDDGACHARWFTTETIR